MTEPTGKGPAASPGEPATQQSIAGASAAVMVGRVGANAGYFVSVFVLARALTPADRGTFAFVTTTALVLAVVAGSGIREGGTVFLARQPDDRPQLATNLLLASVVSGLAGCAVAGAVALLAPGARPAGVDAGSVEIVLGAIFALNVVYAANALTLGVQQFRAQAILQPLFVWLYAATLALTWATVGLTIHSAAILWVAFQCAGAVPLFVLGLRASGFGRPSRRLMRETWRFGIRSWVGSISTYLGFRADQVLMGFISTRTQLGLYAVAVNASEVPLYVPQSVSNALLPLIASRSNDERHERTLRVYRLVILLTFALVVIAAAVGPFLLPIVFGHSFAGATSSFLLLLPGALGFVASSVFSAALAASSAPGLSSVGPLVTLVAGFALDLSLIPPLGADGAAIASSIAFFAGGSAAFVAFRRVEPVRWRELVPGRIDATGIAATLRRGR